MAREHFIRTLIADLLEEHDRVLVVYGKSHLAQQRPVLEDMLGEPVSQEAASSEIDDPTMRDVP